MCIRDSYKPGSWGPKQADKLIAPHGRWHNPAPATANETERED